MNGHGEKPSRLVRLLGVGPLGAVTLLIVGGGFGLLQIIASLTLPHIPPGKEFEKVIT